MTKPPTSSASSGSGGTTAPPLQTVLDAIEAAVVVLDASGKVLVVNEGWRRLEAERRSEAPFPGVGDDFVAMISGADFEAQPAFLQGIRAVVSAAVPEFAGECARERSQTLKWFSVRASRSSEPGETIVTFQDITERKVTEQNHRNFVALYHSLVENLPQSIVRKDVSGRLTFASQRYCQGVGKSIEELLGKTDEDLFPPEVAGRHLRQDALVMQTGQSVESVEEQVVEGEPKRYLQMVRTPLRDAQGQIIGLQAISWDISEQKRAEERIRAQAELLDLAHDAILVRDLDDRILYWSKGAENLYGWTAPEVLGVQVTELFCRPSEVFMTAKQRLLELGQWSDELRHLTRQQHEVVVDSRWTLVRDSTGAPKSVLVIDTDITEKKQLEAQFLRIQRLESIGQLAGGIAHDLNNILAPILMGVSIMRETVQDADATMMLDTMEASANRGAEIVNQILTFARGMKGERVPVQPRHLFKEIENIIRETFPKSVTFKMNAPRDLWMVNGNATQLHQVLINLCVNARDAMPKGGILTLAGKNLELNEDGAKTHPNARPGRYVVWQVADTGMGIPEENLDRIFDPFFTTKELGKGTGLGLSTAMGIIRHHEGFIQVSSKVGQGSQFQVYLPAAEAAPGRQSLPVDAVPKGNGELILFVEDEVSVRNLALGLLQRYGYQTISACDGEEGLRLFEQRSGEIAAVVTDLMMPRMDGIAIVKRIQAHSPAMDKIIACSGYGEEGMIAELQELGIKHFLSKPYTAGKLLETLHQVLSGKTG